MSAKVPKFDQYGLTFAERGRIKLLGLVVFAGVVTASIGFANRAADRLLLRQLYGPERVRRENLYVLDRKPLRISNGDDFGYGPRPFDWLAPVALLAGGGGGTLLAFRALPRRCRVALAGTGGDAAYETQPVGWYLAALGLLLALFLLNVQSRHYPFAPWLGVLAALSAFVACWVRYGKNRRADAAG